MIETTPLSTPDDSLDEYPPYAAYLDVENIFNRKLDKIGNMVVTDQPIGWDDFFQALEQAGPPARSRGVEA